MRYNRETPNLHIVEEYIMQRNLSARQISKEIWGSNTHRNLIAEMQKKPDTRSSTLIKLCNLLDIPIDVIFQSTDNSGKMIPAVVGDNNIVNSSHVNTLEAENKALRLILEEKNQRIDDLKNQIIDLRTRLDVYMKQGPNRDNNY